MQRLAILGSTGSIGTQTLKLVDKYPEKFSITALAAHSNAKELLQQIIKYRPKYAALVDEKAAESIKSEVPKGTELLTGEQSLVEIAGCDDADTLVVAVVGIAGLPSVMEGIKTGKKIALANKEALVTGGELVTNALKAKGQILYPVDSEHSAIFQCLQGEQHKNISRILLTASGGPFLHKSKEEIANVSVSEALAHPKWNMGNKISIDSASLMNKGLEVIEAAWLFDIPATSIQVVVHPESIIHSMVEFCDNSCIAQISNPDMCLPIAYALCYPDRIPCDVPQMDFFKIGQLNFIQPDMDKFPCLKYAYQAIKAGGNMPTVLNAANEVAVDSFLKEKIAFSDIPYIVLHTMEMIELIKSPTIEDIYHTDFLARKYVLENIIKR